MSPGGLDKTPCGRRSGRDERDIFCCTYCVKTEHHVTCCISVSCSARIRDEWSRTERALRYRVGLYVMPFSGVALLKHCTGDLDLRLPIGCEKVINLR